MTISRAIAIIPTLSARSFCWFSGSQLVPELQSSISQAKLVSIYKAFWPEGSSVSELNAAFQIDGNRYHTPYSTVFDKFSLSAW
ncbi:hypothetical protein Acid345_0968 [Candidatus Koribacter versatilis Ellin345]|uniref:Uncharacterized protein n=1 Tax=Koribacter versatilis (strain Ellin345) TaxID=204669 RepID=Q1IT29_KORVE|nr:hypothetical protein [Candidatus Koribacter versatilis]ABF39971.1 hypothetical protein Acid345_0968 [Candidatus Koribacter versatilis Ellin345]